MQLLHYQQLGLPSLPVFFSLSSSEAFMGSLQQCLPAFAISKREADRLWKSCLYKEILHHCCDKGPPLSRLCFCFYFAYWTSRAILLRCVWLLTRSLHFGFRYSDTWWWKRQTSVWCQLSSNIHSSWKAPVNFALSLQEKLFGLAVSENNLCLDTSYL